MQHEYQQEKKTEVNDETKMDKKLPEIDHAESRSETRGRFVEGTKVLGRSASMASHKLGIGRDGGEILGRNASMASWGWGGMPAWPQGDGVECQHRYSITLPSGLF